MRRQYDADRGICTGYYYHGLTAWQRDELIIKLRRKRLSQAKIARALGITQQGVSKALVRVAQGRTGRDPRAAS